MCVQTSGQFLFLMYASVCAEAKLAAKKISQDDYDKILWHLKEKIKPDIPFLEHCFPSAVNEYRETCAKEKTEIDFSYSSVANHWRHNHNPPKHTGICAVKIGKIVSIISTTSNILVCCGSEGLYVKNLHQLTDLKKGDEVYLHKNIPIEKKIYAA